MAEAATDPMPGGAPRSGPPRWSFELRGFAAIWLPGVYAWGATVAWPAFGSTAPSTVARVAAALALLALVGGPVLARRWLATGRALGVLGFAGFSAAAWGVLGNDLRPPLLDPVRSALGSLGWGLFALGWGNFPSRDHLPEDDPHALVASRQPPRARLSAPIQLGTTALFGVALALPLLAWRVERPGVALLAQASALAASVALLGIGTRVLLAPGGADRQPSGVRLWSGLLALWLVLGALVWLF